jgi:voltage-dependent calcium channel N type alpha-1B
MISLNCNGYCIFMAIILNPLFHYNIYNSDFFRVRIGLHWFVTRPFFDGFIMFVILLSSVALALEDPVNEDSDRNKKLGLLDYGFTAIFAIECLLKMLDLGMFLHPGAYLRDVWNVMDISVVSCAILSFYFK